MRDIGRGYLALCSYNCREAINILSQLPSHHYNTGWVLGQVGRAHFELAEYMQVSQGCLNQMTSVTTSSLVSRVGLWGRGLWLSDHCGAEGFRMSCPSPRVWFVPPQIQFDPLHRPPSVLTIQCVRSLVYSERPLLNSDVLLRFVWCWATQNAKEIDTLSAFHSLNITVIQCFQPHKIYVSDI